VTPRMDPASLRLYGLPSRVTEVRVRSAGCAAAARRRPDRPLRPGPRSGDSYAMMIMMPVCLKVTVTQARQNLTRNCDLRRR
jgi:hypothetical protein